MSIRFLKSKDDILYNCEIIDNIDLSSTGLFKRTASGKFFLKFCQIEII